MAVTLNSALLRTTVIAKATAADVDAGTEDVEYITPKALADSAYDILVKATGAELNTGTDDAKFATAQALADSNYALTSDIPSQDLTLNTQTDSYTLVLGDAYKLVAMDKATAVNLTVPLNSSVAYAVGATINIWNQGAGLTTVVATGGVTISTSATLVLRAQNSMATLIKTATDTWVLSGDLTAA
jgi:hypothetical protein